VTDPLENPVVRITLPSLRSALDTLNRSLADGAGDGTVPAEIGRWLRLLAIALQEEDGAIPDAAELSAAEVAGLARLLEQLRAAVIEVWSRDGSISDPEEALHILGAMERARRTLQQEEARDSLVSLLSSSRGPEILIELAHDLRSPLTSILFLSETLRHGRSGELNALQSRQVGIIYSAALNLASLAADVIELARGGRHLMEPRPSPFSVSEVMRSVSDVVRPMAEAKGIALRVRPPRVDHRVGFPVSLSRVLLNLTTNALAATEQGYVEVAADEDRDDRIEFSVRDSGRGIDEETLEHLFRPFRGDRSGDRFGFSGTGLGLAISRKLVAAMEGDLRFHSEPDRGTHFYFRLSLPPADLR